MVLDFGLRTVSSPLKVRNNHFWKWKWLFLKSFQDLCECYIFHLICSCSYSANTFFNIEIGSLDLPFPFYERLTTFLGGDSCCSKNFPCDIGEVTKIQWLICWVILFFLPRVTVTPIVTALVMLIQNDFNFWNFRWPQMRKWQLQQALNWFWLHRWLLSTRWWIWSIIFRTSSVFYIMR